MEKQTIALTTAEIFYARLSATPTPTSWSQVYTAGTLFVVISLIYTEISYDVTALSLVGKDVLNTLEEEYFTLEAKDFEGVRDAVTKALEKIPSTIKSSLSIAVIPPGKEKILYVYTQGNGSVLLRRGAKTGFLLGPSSEFQSASGVLEDRDTILLSTQQFSNTLSQEKIMSSLDLSPSEFVEFFSPSINEGSGAEAAYIFSYLKKQALPQSHTDDIILPSLQPIKPSPEIEEAPIEIDSDPSNNDTPTRPITPVTNTISPFLARLPGMPKLNVELNHTKKLVLTIAVVLIIALVTTIFLTVRQQQEAKNQAEVQKVLEAAEKKYNEGLVLVGLNKNLARDDFEEARQILEEGKKKFSEDSKEAQQINDLLTKVTTSLSENSDSQTVTAQEVSTSANKMLATIIEKKALFATQTENTVYYLTLEGIYSTKQLVKADWKNPGGIGIFGSNIYVLDKDANQIFKFVPAGSSYSKSNYLASNTTAQFSNASSMAIDSAIYVLFADGNVVKYTKGRADTFNISGLPTPFNSPRRIFTNEDSSDIYVLDNGNSRIVVLSKNGAYKSQIQSKILKDAKDFEVNEKQKKVFVLSSNKLYELPLP